MSETADYTALAERLENTEVWNILSGDLEDTAAAIRDLQERLARAKAETLAVLQREAATTARYDAKLDAAERQRDEAVEVLQNIARIDTENVDSERLSVEEVLWAKLGSAVRRARAFLSTLEPKP